MACIVVPQQQSAGRRKTLVDAGDFGGPLKFFAIAADMSFSHEWAVVMRVNDHNVTGAAAAEAGRAQESQRPGRAGGSATGLSFRAL
jgi:hypothetical protein